MKIYTKSGDKGQTSLVDKTTVLKSDERVGLYGDVDELNAWVGYLSTSMINDPQLKILREIQNTLFVLGSNLACKGQNRSSARIPAFPREIIKKLENEMDNMDKKLRPLSDFILPGGAESSSRSHLARTISRRVERRYVDFIQKNPSEVVEGALEFLNRLSDFFFVLSRYLNRDSEDIIWKK